MEQELCPICIENIANCYTECNHSFCINCLCKIKKCAMCRKPLLRENLCKEIRTNFNKKINLNLGRELWSEINTMLDELPSPQDEEYINYENRILNQLEEYDPIISYHGQFPNSVNINIMARWGEDVSVTTRYVSNMSRNNFNINQRPSRIPNNRHYDWLNIN